MGYYHKELRKMYYSSVVSWILLQKAESRGMPNDAQKGYTIRGTGDIKTEKKTLSIFIRGTNQQCSVW
jgi:hypothetical protein